MLIKTEQPQTDIEALVKIIDSGIDVGASPHVGSLDQATNPHYLTLGLRLGVRLEMVDTVTANDKHGRPNIKVVGGQESKLVDLSRREMERVLPVGVALASGGTLESLQVGAVLASGVDAQTTSAFMAEIGIKNGLEKGDVLQAIANSCDGLMRVAESGAVSRDPAKRLPSSAIESRGLFGVGKDPTSGLIVPVQAMSAAELVAAVINGQDTAVHIGGSDMVKYATSPEFVAVAAEIASKALGVLGLKPPKNMRYVILNKNGGITGLPEISEELGDKLGITNFSQHDTIGLDLRGAK